MRALIFALASGVALGVASRVDELNGGGKPISQDVTWLAVALLIGACAATARDGVRNAVAGITVANIAYYGYSLLRGAPWAHVERWAPHWIVIGIAAGVVCGLAGRGARVVSAT